MGNRNSKWSREVTPVIPRYTLTSPNFSACPQRPGHASMGSGKSFFPNRTKQERTKQAAGAPKFIQRLMHASMGSGGSYSPQRTMEEIWLDTDHEASSEFTPRPQDASMGTKESCTPKGSIEGTEEVASDPPSSNFTPGAQDASMPTGKKGAPKRSMEVTVQVESGPPNSKITEETTLASSGLQDTETQKPTEEAIVQTAEEVVVQTAEDTSQQHTMTVVDTLSLDDLEIEIQAMLDIQVLRGLRSHRKKVRAAKERGRWSRWSKRRGTFRITGRYRLSPILEEGSLSEVKRNGDDQKKMEALKSQPFVKDAPPVLDAPHDDMDALHTQGNSQ